MTHRYREHCGPNYDDDLNYRDEIFLKYWKERDIIKIIEEKLSEYSVSTTEISDLKERIDLYIQKEYSISEQKAKIKFGY